MSEPFIGQVQLYAFNFPPRNWALCDGQILSIAQNTALFSLLGTTYGGDGQTTFALPDLRGRYPMHFGQGAGLSSRSMGEKSGEEAVILNTNQIPSHSHALRGVAEEATSNKPENNVLAAAMTYHPGPTDVDLNAGSIGNTGNSFAHNNMPPFLAMNWSIALTGIFPPRN